MFDYWIKCSAFGFPLAFGRKYWPLFRFSWMYSNFTPNGLAILGVLEYGEWVISVTTGSQAAEGIWERSWSTDLLDLTFVDSIFSQDPVLGNVTHWRWNYWPTNQLPSTASKLFEKNYFGSNYSESSFQSSFLKVLLLNLLLFKAKFFTRVWVSDPYSSALVKRFSDWNSVSSPSAAFNEMASSRTPVTESVGLISAIKMQMWSFRLSKLF